MWQAFCDIMGKWDEWGVGEWTSLTPFMEPENQEKYFPHLAAFTSQHTGEELVQRSIEYSKSGRLAPITPVIAPIVSPADALKDPNWVERGMFLTVEDPVYGEVVVAQSQYKLTETPIRTKWVCRPVGYDNEFIYNQFLGFGASQIRALKKKGVI
jgi:crotonobetainyl-CoA:carnitine CoA-transferase CaiB-like acyl-CoA transferase